MILALESSCDETAVAVHDPARGIVGEWIHSQVALHGRHGGVVPDLATREHLRQFAPLLARARELPEWGALTGIAVTNGPGLAACLAIGVAAGKALSVALDLPLVGVNHLRGHAWSAFMPVHAGAPAGFQAALDGLLPHLGLVVSGGNTLLFAIDEKRRLSVISSTRDDAAGEALDKGAKLLGLGYPGGPLIEKRARDGDRSAFDFPRGIGVKADLDFSFSGLKTSLRYLIERTSVADVEARMADLCASYQEAVVDALVRKAGLAMGRGRAPYRSIGISGGVSNNQRLREAFGALAARCGVPLLAAEPRHTGDNAGMIAFAAWIDPDGCDRSGLGLSIAPDRELV